MAKNNVMLGRAISYNLDQTRREVKELFKMPTLTSADDYIAKSINKILRGLK